MKCLNCGYNMTKHPIGWLCDRCGKLIEVKKDE